MFPSGRKGRDDKDMKQRTALLFISLAFLCGCESAYNVVVREDPYKQSVLVRLDMRHKASEGDLSNEAMTYEREIKGGKKSAVTVFFRFFAPPSLNGKDLEDKMYLAVDGRYFTAPIYNKKAEMQSEYTYPPGGHRYYWTGPITVAESRYITGKFQLPPDVEEALGKAAEYTFRVYMDSESTTFKTTANQLQALKQFLAAVR
jgi:hypothetical protein